MIDLTSRIRRRKGAAELNMAPLIDMIFILLIFFLVTTSFSRETGVEVSRPKAVSAKNIAKNSILVAVTREGHIYMHNRRVDLGELGALVREGLAANPNRAVVIIADKHSITGAVIDVMDECNLAGARRVSIASSVEEE
jgi:biopolymer transport protein ExbD